MTSQRAVLESLIVTGRQMNRRGSSGSSYNSTGGVLLEQLEDMNQRLSNLAVRAADIRLIPMFINIIVRPLLIIVVERDYLRGTIVWSHL